MRIRRAASRRHSLGSLVLFGLLGVARLGLVYRVVHVLRSGHGGGAAVAPAPPIPAPAAAAVVAPAPAEPDFGSLQYTDVWSDGRGTLWVVGERGLVLRSRDGGRRWDRVPSPSEERLATVIGFRGAIYVGGYDGLFRTRDGGATWSRPWDTEDLDVRDLWTDGHRLYIAAGAQYECGSLPVVLVGRGERFKRTYLQEEEIDRVDAVWKSRDGLLHIEGLLWVDGHPREVAYRSRDGGRHLRQRLENEPTLDVLPISDVLPTVRDCLFADGTAEGTLRAEEGATGELRPTGAGKAGICYVSILDRDASQGVVCAPKSGRDWSVSVLPAIPAGRQPRPPDASRVAPPPIHDEAAGASRVGPARTKVSA